MNSLVNVMNQFGITTQEAYEAISHIPQIPFNEVDIVHIKNNQNLNFIRKWKLISEIKKAFKGD